MNGQTTGFLYGGAQAIAELRGGSIDTVYHTGMQIDEVLARYAPTGNRTLLTDALMSVIAQANDAQGIDNFYAYSAYGETAVLGPDGGNALRYTGREDDGNGLFYYRARYYDPVLKRFVSEDPIGLEAGNLNFHEFVNSDPTNSTDPEGLTGRRGSGNPRTSFGQSNSWQGQQGAWFRGQFYPRFGQAVQSPTQTTSRPLSYCPIPPVGTPSGSSSSRTLTSAPPSAAGQMFIQNSGPGPYTISSTPSGGMIISAPGATGGTTQIRLMPNGSTRVDIFPGGGAVPTTVHFD